jgi:hypothetical protein
VATSVTISKPTTFAELLEVVEAFQAGSSASWYRGCTKAAYPLKPSLFRHPTHTAIEKISSVEIELTTRFVQRSLPFLQRPLTDEWDKLFFMQHYGVPTRLLDWSENPFVAIFFALAGEQGAKPSDAAIWMCDPIAWNQAALGHISFKGGVLDQSSSLLRPYTPGTPVEEMPTLPIMIYGSYNSPRIVAQRGGFALFGQGTDPMEKVYLTEKFPDGVLHKIEIAHDKVAEICASLFRKGFSESVVFPDLDGLSRELKRVFAF